MAWPHISEAIQSGKRERGEEELEVPEARKRTGSATSRANKAAASPTPKLGLHLNIGGIGEMDVEEKRAMLL